MEIIYQPKGAAREYADLALNIYKGCTHGCRYCYGPGVSRMSAKRFRAAATPKKSVIEHVFNDAEKLAELDKCPEILISFLGDPYQVEELRYGLTRYVIGILVDHDLPFTILTKGGTRIFRDFDLLMNYPLFRFGTSLSFFCDDFNARKWEPNAALVEDRIRAIVTAHQAGISTWVSLEPVIIPEHAIQLIKRIHPFVDHWKIGKLNHYPAREKYVDWIRFHDEVVNLLDDLGADYYLKNSLTRLNDSVTSKIEEE